MMIFNPLSFLKLKTELWNHHAVCAYCLATSKAFGQFSLNLVRTLCVPTGPADGHLMVETYREFINGFIKQTHILIFSMVYLHDYL